MFTQYETLLGIYIFMKKLSAILNLPERPIVYTNANMATAAYYKIHTTTEYQYIPKTIIIKFALPLLPYTKFIQFCIL